METTTTPNGAALLEELPAELLDFATALDVHGIRIHLVGGPVRDLLAGCTPSDLDITSPARPEQLRAVLRVVGGVTAIHDVGERHGTTGFHLDGISETVEHTTHRTERYEPGSRQPIVVFGTSLVEDLARRDFTLNAIALDLVDGNICDPFDGAAALRDGLLICPSAPERTFREDPLRICRLVRFAATRGWRPDDTTAAAATAMRGHLADISAERISAEMWKICVAGGDALDAAIDLACTLGVAGATLGVPDDAALPAEPAELEGDPVAAAAFLANESGNPRRWCNTMKLPKHRTAHILSAIVLCEKIRRGAIDAVTLRRATPEATSSGIALAAASYDGIGGSVEAAAALAAEPWLRAPLSVDGHDCIAVGITGRDIAAALDAVTLEHCARGGIDRADALELIAAAAR